VQQESSTRCKSKPGTQISAGNGVARCSKNLQRAWRAAQPEKNKSVPEEMLEAAKNRKQHRKENVNPWCWGNFTRETKWSSDERDQHRKNEKLWAANSEEPSNSFKSREGRAPQTQTTGSNLVRGTTLLLLPHLIIEM
jgi:hypothetical protein